MGKAHILLVNPLATGQVQKPPAAPAGSGVEAARRLKAKLEKFYREVEGIPWNLGWKTRWLLGLFPEN